SAREASSSSSRPTRRSSYRSCMSPAASPLSLTATEKFRPEGRLAAQRHRTAQTKAAGGEATANPAGMGNVEGHAPIGYRLHHASSMPATLIQPPRVTTGLQRGL